MKQPGWTILPEVIQGTRRGYRILASHYRYKGDSQESDRHTTHRPRWDDGMPLLHGHTHARDHGPKGHQFHEMDVKSSLEESRGDGRYVCSDTLTGSVHHHAGRNRRQIQTPATHPRLDVPPLTPSDDFAMVIAECWVQALKV